MAAKNKLTKRQCETAAGPKLHSDGGGLYLKVTASKTRSWVFRWGAGGKNVIGLGPFPAVGLAAAREKADECRRLIASNQDPIAVRAEQQTGSQTFKDCAERFIASQEAGWKNPKHRQQWANTLSTYAYPVIGDMSVENITTDHVLRILEPIWETKTETASRVQQRMNRVFNYAKTFKLFDGQNPAQWQGHLENLLPPAIKVKDVKHRPAMPYAEMSSFMPKLQARGAIASLLLEFQILTATRPSQPRLARWSEIEGNDWVIPQDRTKNRKSPHRVPLSRQALGILERMRELGEDGLIFPGQRMDRPMSDATVEALMKRMGIQSDTAVPHGFRSTFKDWAGEVAAYPNELSEMALGHTIRNKAEEAYRRGVFLERRRDMMQHWADFCDGEIQHEGRS